MFSVGLFFGSPAGGTSHPETPARARGIQLQHDQFKYAQGDKLAIKAPGVDSLEDVHQHLSATEKGDTGGTWQFGEVSLQHM